MRRKKIPAAGTTDYISIDQVEPYLYSKAVDWMAWAAIIGALLLIIAFLVLHDPPLITWP